MNTFITIVGIAVSLAIDALVVSVAAGVAIHGLRVRHALRIATLFGVFQAVMPVLGWLGGNGIHTLVTGVEHWIVFGIFVTLGVKMIYEAFLMKGKVDEHDYTSFSILLLLAFATSIDAFAIGFSFVLIHVPIIEPILIIGVVTFLLSFTGIYIGNLTGKLIGTWVEGLGGVILVGFAVRILVVGHLVG